MTQAATPLRSRRRLLAALGTAPWALGAAPSRAADAYPSRPVRIIVPFAAGGGADVLARPIAEALSRRMGQPFIVDNRPGVGGNLGTDAVAKAAPDGYTLLLTPPAPIAQAVALYRKLPYDPQTDLVLLSDVAMARVACVVNASMPVRSFQELLAWSKANPMKLTIGSWGPGSQPHIVQVFMDKTFGTQTIHVPYKGEGPLVTDLVGGQILMTCGSITTLAPHIASGKLRALATIGPTRAAALRDVPTFAEIGYPHEVLQLTGPYAMAAPAKTPPAIVERLGREIVAVMRAPEMVRRIEEMGMEAGGNTPAESAAGYRARQPVLTRAIRDTGVTLD